MSVKTLIHKFSAGKITPKYHITAAKHSKFTRNLLVSLTASISIILLYLVSIGLESEGRQGTLLLLCATFFLALVPTYLVGKALLNYSIIGEIRFYDESFRIKQKGENRTIEYADILRINYIGLLKKSYNNAYASIQYETYKVKLYLKSGENILLELKNEMHFEKKDDDQFRSNPPLLLHIFEAINPKYGIMTDSRI